MTNNVPDKYYALPLYPMEERYAEYLQDESNWKGNADSISFPKNEEEVCTLLARMRQENCTITVQGGRTGIVGAAVPDGGHIMNLSHMNRVLSYRVDEDGRHLLDVEPGTTLLDLHAKFRSLKSNAPLFWPVESTELTATVGGVAASNAKGLCAGYYGSANQYIDSLRVVLPDGTVHDFVRGQKLAGLEQEDADAVSIFLGSEGMLGTITRLTLELRPLPKEQWGIAFFFTDTAPALGFCDALAVRQETSGAAVAAVEYLEDNCIALIEERKPYMSKIKELPDVPAGTAAMVYLEIHGDSTDTVETVAEEVMMLAAEWDSDPDTAWAVSGESELEKTRAFRHAAAESANVFIKQVSKQEPRITKLATDMSAENASLSELMQGYRHDMDSAGIRASVFGHGLSGHLHINFLPEDYSGYCKARELLTKWADEMAVRGGRLSTEHGIGKIKRHLSARNCPPESQLLYRIKRQLDPDGILNPHNYWEDAGIPETSL